MYKNIFTDQCGYLPKMQKQVTFRSDKPVSFAVSENAYAALTSKQYIRGSCLSAANNGLHLYDAWMLTGERKYPDAAAAQIHYLLGRNCPGLCFVTGCGTDAVKHPHHRPSGFRGKAMPGMLSGGPCDRIADEVMKSMFTKETAPARDGISAAEKVSEY